MNYRYPRTGILVFLIVSFIARDIQAKITIAVIGTGYVGLVTGAGLAEIGNTVICADIDTHKINDLKNIKMPIYEPGLETLVEHNTERGTLAFTDNVQKAIAQADIIFISVGTPMAENGAADLSAVYQVVDMIAQQLKCSNVNSYKIICTKSTVPVGTGAHIRTQILAAGIHPDKFALVSNPEFLREGVAVNDFLNPDRIIIGVESEQAKNIMQTIYQPMIDRNIPVLWTTITTSETIKYASNGFLATKISFINEMSNFCKQTGADIYGVAKGMGMDKRIGPLFLNPGPGFGGSCFPKDCHALLYMAQHYNVPFHIIEAALKANEYQKVLR